MKLAGIFASLPTPFDHRGELYMAKVRHNVEKWNRTQLSGYVVAGLAGEGVLLTCEEKVRLWEAVREALAPPEAAGAAATPGALDEPGAPGSSQAAAPSGTPGALGTADAPGAPVASSTLAAPSLAAPAPSRPGKLLIAGVSMESVRETAHLAKLAAGLGYHAALVRAPYCYQAQVGNAVSQAAFFRAVADRSAIPVIADHDPQTSGVDLPAPALAGLAAHPNIVAVREGSEDAEKIGRMARESPSEFQVLAGAAPALAASLAGGAAGAILDFAAAAPYACLSIYEAVRTREHQAAQDLQRGLTPAAALTARHGVPGLKYAMDLNGYYGGPPRLPLLPAGAGARREIEAAFRDLKG